MNADAQLLPPISIVVITYNRIQTLEPTIKTLLSVLDYPREKLELIITDDGSDPEVMEQIEQLPHDKLVRTDGVKGLAANANRGLRAATHDLVFQIQDDWNLTETSNFLAVAVQIFDENPDVGMVLLNQHPNKSLVHEKRRVGNRIFRVFENCPEKKIENTGDHGYSDWPQLKKREFTDHIGPYNLKEKVWTVELDYSRRINAQTRFHVADIVDLDAFGHTGEEFSYNYGPIHARVKGALLKFGTFREIRRIKNSLLK